MRLPYTKTNINYELSKPPIAIEMDNVLSVITDHLLEVQSTSTSGVTDYFQADLVSSSDYYPFGSQMLGRSFSTNQYRYGFNGMEKDDEVSGSGNSYTTYFRQYDPRLGRWLSLDPLIAKFPWQSPYCAYDNNPIYFKDPSGAAGEGGTTEVKEGEGAYAVAKRNGVTPEELAKANPDVFKNYDKYDNKADYWGNKDKNYMLHPNQKLNIPDKNTPKKASKNSTASNTPSSFSIIDNDGNKVVEGEITPNYVALTGYIITAISYSADAVNNGMNLNKFSQLLANGKFQMIVEGNEFIYKMGYSGGRWHTCDAVRAAKGLTATKATSGALWASRASAVGTTANIANVVFSLGRYKFDPSYGNGFEKVGGKEGELGFDLITGGASFVFPLNLVALPYQLSLKPALQATPKEIRQMRNENSGLYGTTPSGRKIPSGYGLQYSDSTLKFDIIKIDSALFKVNLMNGYNYKWKREILNGNTKKDIGVLAQEVEACFPEIVTTNSDGDLMVYYYKLIPVLIEAIKEQQKQIKQNEQIINELRIKINEFEKTENISNDK